MQLTNSLGARVSRYQSQIEAAVSRVLSSGWLVLGPEVKQFEQSFATYVGGAHCISLANGTDAIELALRSFGVARGDQVATVANAGMYTSNAILAIGAIPFFMDVDEVSGCAVLAEVARAIDVGVKAIVITHLYGLAAPEIVEIAKYCREKKIFLLEDCAQCHGAEITGRRTGTFGDAASFSFYPTKNLGALGDGGAVVTNSAELAETIKKLRQYGWSSKYNVELPGGRNSRLDELQAAILSVFLPDLDEANARRRAIAARYAMAITHPDIRLPAASGREYVAHLYVVRSNLRDSLALHLRDNQIASDVHYPIPDHRQAVFGGRFLQIVLPVTELLAKEILTLPCYPEMTDEEVDRVVTVVNSWETLQSTDEGAK